VEEGGAAPWEKRNSRSKIIKEERARGSGLSDGRWRRLGYSLVKIIKRPTKKKLQMIIRRGQSN